MGLGRLLTSREVPGRLRSTKYTVSDTVTGATAVYTITDNMAPDWASSSAYRGGMSIPGGWRAALAIAGLLGRLPWDAHRMIADRPEEKLFPRPPLLEQPAPPDSRLSTFRSLGLDYLWHGNAIVVIAARNAQNTPVAGLPVPATSVSVRRVTRFVDSPLPIGALEYKIGSMSLGSGDVLHFKGPCEPGAVRGMGVLENHFNTLQLAQDQSRQARSVSQHGVPTGVLKSDNPDLTDTEAAELKASWMASQSTRTVAVVNASTTFEPLSWNPEELQLVAARKFTLNEFELIFGLPVGWLGGSDSSRKYSNMSQDDVAFMKWSMGDHIEQFEQTLSLAYPRGTLVRANQDAVLQADTLSRYQAHAIALDKEFLTRDEVRELEHRPPLPEKPAEADPFAGDERARPFLGESQLRHPGHSPQKVHGGHSGGGVGAGGMQEDATIREAYTFRDKTGVTARVTGIRESPYPGGGRYADIEFTDASGAHVGSALRTISGDGKSVDHSDVSLFERVRGQGIMTRYNAHAESVYRKAGVERITLSAGKSVGGYAWARAGYQFRYDSSRREIANRFVKYGRQYDADVQDEIGRVAGRRDATPLELAMIGHRPGAKSWPGKEILLYSEWDGVKELGQGTRAAGLTAQAMLDAAGKAYEDWCERYADEVPYVDVDAAGLADYAEHHADVSAPPSVDDVLNTKLKSLIAAREQG